MDFDSFKKKLTPTYHSSTYPTINPTRPELSQAGKTVLITGASAGIGYHIAKAFVQAKADKVIILGRRVDKIKAAAETLSVESQGTKVVGLSCDVGSATAVAELWGRLAGEGTRVDVLVLNAANVGIPETLMEQGTKGVWEAYDFNVRAQFDMTERFYKQELGAGSRKYLIHVSTLATHDFDATTQLPTYGLSKHAGALTLQFMAMYEIAAEDMQVVIYHPGAIFTEACVNAGFTEDSQPWEDASIPAGFAVWGATPEAEPIHGRFVCAAWDVDELRSGELGKRLREDRYFLRFGVNGLYGL
ncbi:NAD(P)-binding protein [Daldinia caldariorum]|uniref:NAD(P)-binding protein n=1 Tax=Daldinia caldariorum TaxID=326644 RepID=UPI0020079841|nr:NAD(P)-binding protein [Daldinia caldariorum]KAI1470260.1 NAD(P)-binding protein [Daldinia caldariorum]